MPSGGQFRIRDGVRRAIIAAQEGDTEISAEVRDPGGHLMAVRLVPIADLIIDNPLKFSFDLLADQTEFARFQRISHLRSKGIQLDFIWVEPWTMPATPVAVRDIRTVVVVE
jgi:hypothetical protein